jgi:hypothetical protein
MTVRETTFMLVDIIRLKIENSFELVLVQVPVLIRYWLIYKFIYGKILTLFDFKGQIILVKRFAVMTLIKIV